MGRLENSTESVQSDGRHICGSGLKGRPVSLVTVVKNVGWALIAALPPAAVSL